MRIKAGTTKELNDQLREHPALRNLPHAVSPGSDGPSEVSTASIRKVIDRMGSTNPMVAELVTSIRRVAKCRDEGRALLRRSVAGERAGVRASQAYAKKWAGIDRDYRKMVGLSYDLLSSNTTMSAYAVAAKDIDKVHRFANPIFVGRTHRLLFEQLGTDVDDLADEYRYGYLPDIAQLDRSIAKLGQKIPTEGRAQVTNSVFLYAPESLVERGVVTLTGSDLATLSLAIVAAAAVVAAYVAEMERLAAAMKAAEASWLVFLVLWWIWCDRQAWLATVITHQQQLEQQYQAELQLVGGGQESATAEETPASVATEFGYVVGNMSRSKLEVHLPTCSFLRLARPDHLRVLDTIAAAKAAGLDNCFHCIGGSLR